MPHIVVAGPLHPSGCELLDKAQGVTVTYIAETSEASLAAEIATADAVLLRTQPVTAPTIELAGDLKIISRHGVGYDAVDVAALNRRGIALAVCGDVNSASVAEHAAMMILAACKRLIRSDASVRTGPWEWRNKLEARDVNGQNLLLVGYGRIGRKTGEMMRALGMNVRAYDPFLLTQKWPETGVPAVETLDEGLAWADVLSFCLPHTGKALIGAEEIAKMRDGVVLVNTSRGGIIDEEAMIAALQSGKIGAAGLDVFQQEPVPQNHPLVAFDQVLLSPHIGGLTQDAAERMAISSAENILNYFNNTIDPALIVNKDHIHVELKT
ncbi:hydroxyacid dehydrogenase [Yoonia maritima]|uniref:hydroxyacid dehydrogenase n=1 Tax=Yoonia maritima TaxID=1435347 RepID=UPI000D10E906|nr:hydroxyacid dehydrogenase [Yoonia maritima]